MAPVRFAGAAALVLAAVFAAPVAGQTALETETQAQSDITEIPQDLPEEADKFLWCASALHLMGIATGDETEAQTYFAASQLLVQEAATALMEAGIAAQDVEGIVALYDEKVISEFEDGEALAYAPEVCIDALGL